MFAKPSASPAIRALLALTAIPMLAVAASGAPIRYDFSGTITEAEPSTGLLGTRFHGSFTVDDAKLPTTVYNFPSGPRDGSSHYYFGTLDRSRPEPNGTGLEVRFADGTVVRSDGLWASLSTMMKPANGDLPIASLLVGSVDSWVDDEAAPDHSVGLLLVGHDPLAGLNDPIPRDITIEDFSEADFQLLGRYVKQAPTVPGGMPVEGPPQIAAGTIDTLSATPVPEPGWTVAALLGAAACAARRRRRAD
ncbi:hypothetical protein [Paludisphaera sp.]|uniref:hypothetical protein n=1 Tax=Paludisphaera sp. TaxID=2017432 RepID=UPI00301CD6C1